MKNAIRVLLADDTDDMRRLLCTLLEATGRFKIVGEAINGEQAIALAERLTPDVIVLDLAMPVLDGLQATPELRRVSPASAIVILSGFETDRVAESAIAAGADRYVEKGTAISTLAQVIDEAMASRPQTSPSVAPAPPAERPAAPADEATKSVGTYLSQLSHQLRNPLTVLAGGVRTLEARWHQMSDGDRDHLVQMLRRATDRMNELVSDIAEVGAIDSGTLRTAIDSVDLTQIVERAVDDARARSSARHFVVNVPQDMRIVGDARRQAQILRTLLSRTDDASPNAAPVEISAECKDSYIRVCVIDPGGTATDGASGSVFDRFPAMGDTPRVGSGLDLSIIRSLVEAQGGTIDYTQSVDAATFWYTVPIEGSTVQIKAS